MPHPVFALARKEPHGVFLHPRYAGAPEGETAAELADRDAEHRAAALDAIAPEEAAAFAVLTAEQAELAGLCDATMWEDQALPGVSRTDLVRTGSVRTGVRSMLAARAAAGEAAAQSALPETGAAAGTA